MTIYDIIVILLIPVSAYLGHFITMKTFSHVQPSTKDLIEEQKSVKNVSIEPDPWAEEGIEERKEPGIASYGSILEKLEKETGIKISNPNDFVGFEAGEPTGKADR